jgi:hypothetical protein
MHHGSSILLIQLLLSRLQLGIGSREFRRQFAPAL